MDPEFFGKMVLGIQVRPVKLRWVGVMGGGGGGGFGRQLSALEEPPRMLLVDYGLRKCFSLF